MGFVGSLHCAGMCGPLILAVPVVADTRASFLASRLLYNLGRIGIYALLGLFFGLIGQSLVLIGFQRWLSIATGVAMLLYLLLTFSSFKNPLRKGPLWIKSLFRDFLHKRSYSSVFALGAVNGLLPCGLVYMAGTASIAYGNAILSILYMIAFGLGTLPMLIGIALAGNRVIALKKLNVRVLMPIAVSLVAALLIVRGLSLGIPYLSPSSSPDGLKCPACAQ